MKRGAITEGLVLIPADRPGVGHGEVMQDDEDRQHRPDVVDEEQAIPPEGGDRWLDRIDRPQGLVRREGFGSPFALEGRRR